jgi:hypothetical protein
MSSKRNTIISLTLLSFLTFSVIQTSLAQEKPDKIDFSLSADIMSRYVWRGLNLGGSTPSVQPSMELSYGNLTLGTWGAYSFSPAFTQQEVDLYVSYTFAEYFNIMLTDYFLHSEDSVNEFFNYRKDETGHLLELSASFLGTESIPLSLLVATNIYGADELKSNGDLQYSTYLELNYNFTLKDNDCSLFLGVTPTRPDTSKGEKGYYSDKPGIINLGLKACREIPITEKYSLPVSASLITNPLAGNVFLVFGISL